MKSFSKILTTFILTTWCICLHAQQYDFPDFNQYISELEKNRITYNEYNDSVFIIKDHDQWIEYFRRRAAKNHDIYDENKRILYSITHYFSQDEEKINAMAYNSLATSFIRYAIRSSSDPFLTIDIADFLLKYYESGNCPDSLNQRMLMTILKANSFYSIYNMGRDTTALRQSYELYKSVQYIPGNSNFPYYELRRYSSIRQILHTVWYRNHMLSKQELYAFADKLRKIVNSPNTAIPEKAIQAGKQQLALLEENIVHNIYLTMDSTFFEKEYADSLMRIIVTKNLRNKQLSFISYLRTLYMQLKLGELTPGQAFQRAQERYKSERDKLKNTRLNDDDFSEFLNPMRNLLRLNDISGEPYAKRRETVRDYCKTIVTAFQKRLHQQNETKYINYLYSLIANPQLIKYLTEKERINFMNSLMVNVQVPTYAHSRHVGELAEIIMQGVLNYHPELLLGTLDCNTVREVKHHKKQYMEFIRNAAKYHDLGKNTIAPVVVNDYRPLTDLEFTILKQHPAMGLYYLSIAPSLSIYHDTTLGHHKWYNGKGGYPADFDNTQSPLRIMIDIITISDCMQAATEKLGRNYKREISFSDLIKELKRDAGTRYNPDLVSLIVKHKEVADKLSTSIRLGWLEIYYSIYNQYFKN